MAEPDGPAVLVINPGGTSTKVAVFDGERERCGFEVRHEPRELERYERVYDQLELRLTAVREGGERVGIDFLRLSAVVGRGGPVAPVPGGVYAVDRALLDAIRNGEYIVEHASILGAPMAHALSQAAGVDAFVVDPVSVDELRDEARLTGWPSIERRALSHALSVKAASRETAGRLGRPLEELALVVLHLGSGTTVAAELNGQQIDATDASASGPMAPTRAGSLPALDFARLCLSGKHDLASIERMLVGRGGWMAHSGTDDVREMYSRVDDGDVGARMVLDATLLQLAKQTAAMAGALGRRPDAVVVTGGVARSARFVAELAARIEWLTDRLEVVEVGEMRALAQGGLRVLAGRCRAESMEQYIVKMKKEQR